VHDLLNWLGSLPEPLLYGAILLAAFAENIFPPLPAFYHRPASIDEMVNESVERILALLGFSGAAAKEWTGL
jgi:3-polyprenyl-4-hydroxybenzoate decarboxylase